VDKQQGEDRIATSPVIAGGDRVTIDGNNVGGRAERALVFKRRDSHERF
jgi:hypothetical protein